MKALSIRQPWPYAILYLGKPIENRSRGTSHRGITAIHASLKYDKDGEAWLKARGYQIPDNLPTGGVVGTAYISGVIPKSEAHLMRPEDQEWFFGPVGYALHSPQPCKFIPYRGMLGFFDIPDELVRAAA